MENKFKYLFKNTGLLMIGNFSSKILVFLLVPFYTSILTTSEYGTYDLVYSSIQMLLPVLSLNIIDGVMRFTIGETRENQNETFTIGLKYITVSCIAMAAILFGLKYVFHNGMTATYYWEILFLYIGYALNQFAIQFARGIDDVKGVSIAGVISTGVMIAGNLIFLLWIRTGLSGYFWAYISSFMASAIFLFFRDRMYQYLVLYPKSLGVSIQERAIVRYSLPLMLTTLSWCVNGVADRYAVTYFCGIDVNGIYSVAYKIPSILNAIQTIFIQAWQLSAIRELGNEKGEQFFKAIYEGCQTIMVVLCSGLIWGTRIMARILFAKDFYEAWMFVPTLLLYIVFNTMSGVLGGIFAAAKDTSAFARSAIVGVLVNIVLNIGMVYAWQAEGAAIATVISSIVIWGMRVYYSRRHVSLNINWKKHGLEYFILEAQAIVMTLVVGKIAYLFQALAFAAIVVINRNMIMKFTKGLVGEGKSRAQN